MAVSLGNALFKARDEQLDVELVFSVLIEEALDAATAERDALIKELVKTLKQAEEFLSDDWAGAYGNDDNPPSSPLGDMILDLRATLKKAEADK